ncbi:MAG TPA: ABC transporter substrate-binding protein [Alphaproteobacteria bacterium]|nr:ABC transporter substrate-binding protein [Alphaproteobacteria bacterium]
MKKRTNIRAALTLAAGVLLGTAGASAQTLTIGVRGGPESLDPHFSALGTQAEAAKHIFDTLVWSDDNLQISAGLAESWKPINETTWEFKLRKGVKFHDGSDFTAEDVKFSIERIPVVSGPTTTTIYVKRVAKIEIKDPHTMHLITDGAAATLPYDFVRLFIVSHKAAKDARNEEFNSGKAAVGTGPFKFVSWTPKGDLVLERYDGYWRGKAPWQRVIRKEIPNDASRLAALKAGQVDLINYVSASDYQALRRDAKIKTFQGDSVYVMNLQPDQREKTPRVYDNDGKPLDKNPLRDAKVREALDLAIDRKTMVDVVLEGLGRPANQIMPAGFFGSSPRIPERKFDPERAKKLLAEAGYPNGFKVDLHCTNDRLPGDGAICAGLGQMFTRVGITTNVNAISRTVYFPAQARLEYSLFMNGWGTLTGEGSYTLGSLVHTNDPATKLGPFNRTAYSNPEVDKTLQEAVRTLDDAKRRALFEKAMELSMADRALIPIVVLQTVWAGRADKVTMNPRADEDTLAYYISPAKGG